MKTVQDVIDAAKQALGVESDNAFAQKLGVTRGAVSNWKRGVSLPDTVTCATLAGLTGLPLAQVIGIVGEARAISQEEKKVWRRLAATALACLVTLGATLPREASAHVMQNSASSGAYALCEMKGRSPDTTGHC